jgi:hypothetical protein
MFSPCLSGPLLPGAWDAILGIPANPESLFDERLASFRAGVPFVHDSYAPPQPEERRPLCASELSASASASSC